MFKDPVPLFGAVLAMIVFWHVFKFLRVRKQALEQAQARKAAAATPSSD